VVIKIFNCSLCVGWKCLSFQSHFHVIPQIFVFVGAYYHQFYIKIEIIFDIVV